MEGRTPVVLLNSPPSTQWTALEKWKDWTYVSERIPDLDGVFERSIPIFHYQKRSKPMAAIPGMLTPVQHDLINITTAAFFDRATTHPISSDDGEQKEKKYLYYSGGLHETKWKLLEKDFYPRRFLVAPEAGEGSVTYVWMGGAGSTAQTHYDPTHNFFVQILSHKRFLLSPPSSWRDLYPYPFQHPSDRQSQVNWTDTLENRAANFPAFGSGIAMEVDLQPGEMLYLPPQWFHRVFAPSGVGELSVSINIWSDSLEGDLVELCQQIGLPDSISDPPNLPLMVRFAYVPIIVVDYCRCFSL